MANAKAVNKAPHITKGDVFDDLGLSPAAALEAKVKADIWRELVSHIEGLNLKQRELAARLGVHQPDVSNLLGGKLSKFSVGTLIQFAVKLEFGVQVRFTAPKYAAEPKKISSLNAKGTRSTHRKQRDLAAA